VKAVKEKFKQDITFQFRHFPLTQIHPNAQAAARAAEAASLQGKFWEMHDLLYENQQSWSSSDDVVPIFEQYAQQLGLDVNKFKQDFSSSQVNDTINADIKAGQEIGANSTPTFVLNGQKLDQNPANQAAFEKLISDAIAAKKSQQ
jgi:protein-disulfide isomerase